MKPLPSHLIAYGCLSLSMALTGSYVALSKPLVAALPVFLLAWMRFGIAAIAMLPWLRKPANEAPMTAQVRRLLFLESFVGNFLFSICMLYGVSMTSAVSAGVILAGIPAMIALMSWLFLGERISPRMWAAALCAALGLLVLALARSDIFAHAAPSTATPPQAWLGNLLVFGAVVCEGGYAVIAKKLTGTLGPKRISSLINLWGFALMTPFGLTLALDFDFGAVRVGTWLLLVFYALAASMGTVWLWMTGARHLPAAHGGIFTVMLPISAA
ncbi:MAG: DMT family transporter, partial [Burkholderiaceae bacterium]